MDDNSVICARCLVNRHALCRGLVVRLDHTGPCECDHDEHEAAA